MGLTNKLSFPPLVILNAGTGERREMNYDSARIEIAFGDWIETIPSDPERARAWLAELRERVLKDSKDAKVDLSAFLDFEAWCDGRRLYALPAEEKTVVLYLLNLAKDGAADHDLREMSRRIAVVHELAKHPPRHLMKLAWDGYLRAISFAKFGLRETTGALDMARVAPAKAIEMFPDGRVPLRWNDVAA